MGTRKKADVISIKTLRDVHEHLNGDAASLLAELEEHVGILRDDPKYGPITPELLTRVEEAVTLVQDEYTKKKAPTYTMYDEIRGYVGLVRELLESGETDLTPGSYLWCAVKLLTSEMMLLLTDLADFNEPQ